jgi:hypothetical protein
MDLSAPLYFFLEFVFLPAHHISEVNTTVSSSRRVVKGFVEKDWKTPSQRIGQQISQSVYVLWG